MSKVIELLRCALEKQKKRFFLSKLEKDFINDAESLLAEKNSDSNLIYRVRLKLNFLIDQFNSAEKYSGALDDLISVVLYCKIEIINAKFKFFNFDGVKDLINEKKFS